MEIINMVKTVINKVLHPIHVHQRLKAEIDREVIADRQLEFIIEQETTKVMTSAKLKPKEPVNGNHQKFEAFQ